MKKWTDQRIEAELRACVVDGVLPSVSKLKADGKNDLVCAATKTGGVIRWAERMGVVRADSDSDFGWRGEDDFVRLCQIQGIRAVRSSEVKAPWDITADDILRIDVKTANHADYGACRGWFYRIGKRSQADLVVLYQADTQVFYGIPWWLCPTSNITISHDGGKYAPFRQNWSLIRQMLYARQREQLFVEAWSKAA